MESSLCGFYFCPRAGVDALESFISGCLLPVALTISYYSDFEHIDVCAPTLKVLSIESGTIWNNLKGAGYMFDRNEGCFSHLQSHEPILCSISNDLMKRASPTGGFSRSVKLFSISL
ncbi:hypothetical protein CR513_34892, partial [Mucuna pruriens]